MQVKPQPHQQMVSEISLVDLDLHIQCDWDERRHSLPCFPQSWPRMNELVHPQFSFMEFEFPAWLGPQHSTVSCQLSPLEKTYFLLMPTFGCKQHPADFEQFGHRAAIPLPILLYVFTQVTVQDHKMLMIIPIGFTSPLGWAMPLSSFFDMFRASLLCDLSSNF